MFLISRTQLLATLMAAANFFTLSQAAQRPAPPPREHIAAEGQLIPPATPLVACDPYFSVWSPADKLTDKQTVHWTGKPHPLSSIAVIDGKQFRVMGQNPEDFPPLTQKSLDVLPTRTIYTFDGPGVALTLTFLTPVLPHNIEILSRPVTYVIYDWRSTDSKNHEVWVYFDASALLAVNTPDQQVAFTTEKISGLETLKIGSIEQPILAKRGDDIRIDWGYLYLSAPDKTVDSVDFPRPLTQHLPHLQGAAVGVAPPTHPSRADEIAAALHLKKIRVGKKSTTQWLMLVYDDLYSIRYMKKDLRPYWRRNGWEAADLLKASARDFNSLRKQCESFDAELMADLTRAG